MEDKLAGPLYEGRVVEDSVSERSVRILNKCLAMLYAQLDEKDKEIQWLREKAGNPAGFEAANVSLRIPPT